MSRENCTEVEPFIYFDIVSKTLYMPWATDLLPHQIDALKIKLKSRKKSNKIVWVGTIGDGLFGNINQLTPFINAAKDCGYQFLAKSPGNASIEQNIDMVMNAFMAPAIVGSWQQEKGYIPCRIFKNISYGALGITNSKRVYELFEKKIVYNPDCKQLFFDAKIKLNSFSVNDAISMMDYVKHKHTYINRIDRIIEFFDMVKKQYKLN